jgi:hypothetical protein
MGAFSSITSSLQQDSRNIASRGLVTVLDFKLLKPQCIQWRLQLHHLSLQQMQQTIRELLMLLFSQQQDLLQIN